MTMIERPADGVLLGDPNIRRAEVLTGDRYAAAELIEPIEGDDGHTYRWKLVDLQTRRVALVRHRGELLRIVADLEESGP